MTKAREITRDDIMAPEAYAAERKERRVAMMPVKRERRVEVGPYATFYFENFDTMWHQIHEMLHIERGGEEQIEDELSAYNPLIPKGQELVATVMFEINDPKKRERVLYSIAGIEEHAFFEVEGERVSSDPEHDIDRTSADGKSSSVHFLHFRFTPEQIEKFRKDGARIVLGFDHDNYAHMTVLPEATRKRLADDFV